MQVDWFTGVMRQKYAEKIRFIKAKFATVKLKPKIKAKTSSSA